MWQCRAVAHVRLVLLVRFVLVLQAQHLRGIHTYEDGTPSVGVPAPGERRETAAKAAARVGAAKKSVLPLAPPTYI